MMSATIHNLLLLLLLLLLVLIGNKSAGMENRTKVEWLNNKFNNKDFKTQA